MELGNLLVLLVVVGVIFALRVGLRPRKSDRRAREARGFARSRDLPLTPELEAELAGRLRRRMICELTGIALAIAVFVGFGVSGGGIYFGWLAGLAVGRCGAQAVEARRAMAGGARVTHLLAPRLADYVHPLSVLCVHVIALLPVGLGLVWFTAPARSAVPQDGPAASWPALDWVVAGAMAVPLAALLFADLGAWLVVRLRRVAATPVELALDDAFRATTLRDLAGLPVLSGLLGASTMGSALNHVLPAGPLAWLGSPMPSVLALGMAVVAISVELATVQRWRRRLHPELEPR
jgi:hypothetical protein